LQRFGVAALEGQSEQLSDVTTRLHKALTKLELCQGQLEKKQREVKELQEAAKVRLAGQGKQQPGKCCRLGPIPTAQLY
jgi:phage shock protein A